MLLLGVFTEKKQRVNDNEILLFKVFGFCKMYLMRPRTLSFYIKIYYTQKSFTIKIEIIQKV